MANRKLVLEDGTEYLGRGFGSESEKLLELVFNTSMVGYQEILTDPSYTDQAVVMTYPLMGNYGINEEDMESRSPSIGALIAREYTENPSNFRSVETLSDFMKRNDIAGIYGIDTRELTRVIRNTGSCKVLITDAEVPKDECMKKLAAYEYAHDHVSRVSTKESWVSMPEGIPEHHVVAVDCGMKLNIVRHLNDLGCKVTVVPWNTSADEVKALEPDGVFFSNGPGDPVDVVPTIELMKALHGVYPIFGICLGHQVLSLSYGARTYKLKFGHRGGNHPVKNLNTDKIEITSQNHSYAVDADSLEETPLKVTHINMLDNTVEGVWCAEDKAFSVQYHPESAPGPQDSSYLFKQFIKIMKGGELDA